MSFDFQVSPDGVVRSPEWARRTDLLKLLPDWLEIPREDWEDAEDDEVFQSEELRPTVDADAPKAASDAELERWLAYHRRALMDQIRRVLAVQTRLQERADIDPMGPLLAAALTGDRP